MASQLAFICSKLTVETLDQCSKLTRKTPKRCHWRRSSVFVFNCEHIYTLLLCFCCEIWTCKCWLDKIGNHNLLHVNLGVSQLNIQPNKYGDGDWKLYSKSSKSKITKPLRNSVKINNKKIINFLNNWKVGEKIINQK